MACPAKFRGRTNQPIHQANACGEARDAEFAKLQTWITGTRRFSGEPQRAAGAATALAQVRGRPELQLHGHESCVVWLAALLALQPGAETGGAGRGLAPCDPQIYTTNLNFD